MNNASHRVAPRWRLRLSSKGIAHSVLWLDETPQKLYSDSSPPSATVFNQNRAAHRGRLPGWGCWWRRGGRRGGGSRAACAELGEQPPARRDRGAAEKLRSGTSVRAVRAGLRETRKDASCQGSAARPELWECLGLGCDNHCTSKAAA